MEQNLTEEQLQDLDQNEYQVNRIYDAIILGIFIPKYIQASIYDVDMFRHDIQQILFTETDPQDIDEDDFVIYQQVLVMLVRNELVWKYYGMEGTTILLLDLLKDGEDYYINKVIFKVN